MNAWAEDRRSRMSTPRNWIRPPNRRAAAARCGASSLHGPHHDAQTFTTTGTPRSCPSSSLNRSRSNSGSVAGSVGSRRAEVALRARPAASPGEDAPAPVDALAHAVAASASATMVAPTQVGLITTKDVLSDRPIPGNGSPSGGVLPDMRWVRVAALMAVTAMVLAACSAGARQSRPSASLAAGGPAPLIDLDRIVAGGPPPDGIPPIDHPKFLPGQAVRFLAPQEPVLAVEVRGLARAYPLRIMMWHEIVNDVAGGETEAFPFSELRREAVDGTAVAGDRVGDTPIVVFWAPGTVSALDAPEIPDSEDVGAAVAFRPILDGRTLSFSAGPTGITDEQTGSRWNIEGLAVDGPLAGRRLQPAVALDSFWFDWAAFHPDTRIFRSE